MKLPLSGSMQREITINSHFRSMKNAEFSYENALPRDEGTGRGPRR
jgi:hypothetical protein